MHGIVDGAHDALAEFFVDKFLHGFAIDTDNFIESIDKWVSAYCLIPSLVREEFQRIRPTYSVLRSNSIGKALAKGLHKELNLFLSRSGADLRLSQNEILNGLSLYIVLPSSRTSENYSVVGAASSTESFSQL